MILSGFIPGYEKYTDPIISVDDIACHERAAGGEELLVAMDSILMVKKQW